MESTLLTARIQDIDYNHQDEIMMKLRKLFAGLTLLSGLFASPAWAVIVFTEDFEAIVSPGVIAGVLNPGFLPVVGLNPLDLNVPPNWIVSGSVDLIRGAFGAIDSVSLDLSGTGPGTITHTFTAVAGLTYTLAWDMFRNGSGSAFTAGLGAASFTLPQGIVAGLASPESVSLNWLAPVSGTTTLFFGGGAGNSGPTIDNIVLTAVPEPSPIAFMAIGLLLIVFLSRRRLNRN